MHACISFLLQDPDRGPCTPADCAIKYKGKRNFYRNSTGKCEPVVECNTRGDDDTSIVAVSHVTDSSWLASGLHHCSIMTGRITSVIAWTG